MSLYLPYLWKPMKMIEQITWELFRNPDCNRFRQGLETATPEERSSAVPLSRFRITTIWNWELFCHLDDGELKTTVANKLMNRWFATSINNPSGRKVAAGLLAIFSIMLLLAFLVLLGPAVTGVSTIVDVLFNVCVRPCCDWPLFFV